MIDYLETVKDQFIPLTPALSGNIVSNIDNEIKYIEKTDRCEFPIVVAAVFMKVETTKTIYYLLADWIEKKPEVIKTMHVQLYFDSHLQSYSFDVPGISGEHEIYSDAYFVGFTSDPNLLGERSNIYLLPSHFSEASAYISLEENNGNRTPWIKCLNDELRP